MATLNAVFGRFTGKRDNHSAAHAAAVPLRAFANENIYFHVKRFDNSRLVRQADPAARRNCWSLIGSVAAAAVLLIGVLLPSAYGLMAGYQIQNLKGEAKRLDVDRASLELQEVKLVSPERMERLAREQRFSDPDAQKVVFLESRDGSSVAMNQGQRK